MLLVGHKYIDDQDQGFQDLKVHYIYSPQLWPYSPFPFLSFFLLHLSFYTT